MITDPIGDLLTRIRNAALTRKLELSVPYSKACEAVALVLKDEGYVSQVNRVLVEVRGRGQLALTLATKRRKPVITGIRNVSRPGLRIYRQAKKLPNPLSGAGVSIISTSKGVMTDRAARKLGLGGEVLGEVW